MTQTQHEMLVGYLEETKCEEQFGAKHIAVINPFDGSPVGYVPDQDLDHISSVVQQGYNAQTDWSRLTGKEKAQMLRAWFNLVVEHREELARILTKEMGKPIREARGEVDYGASFIEWFAEEAKRIYGDLIPGHQRDKRLMVMKQPVGLVAAITPWNFPIAMVTRKVAPALAAGCAIVLKPDSSTPLSALALRELAIRAGVPSAVFQVVTTQQTEEVSRLLCDSPLIRKITFTGSTRVGKILSSQSAETLKKLSLELGGNAPFIVFNDADVDAAVEGAMQSKYRNAGQTCVCANRFIVQAEVYDAFVDELTEASQKLRLGDGLCEETEVGPLINAQATEKVQSLVADAIRQGAQVTTGGDLSDLDPPSSFLQPTVLTNLNADMAIHDAEIFGPVAPVFKFRDDEEAISLANSTEVGLASYFYTKDFSRAWRVAERIEAGMVGINTGQISTEVAPFGGIKQSGQGREGSRYGIEDYLELKYVCASVG